MDFFGNFSGILGQQVVEAGGGTLTVESITPYTQISNITSHSVPMPATVNAGDLLLMLWAHDSNIYTASAATFTDMGGSVGGGGCTTYVFAKVATGSEGGATETVTVTNVEAAGAIVYRISNWGGTIATSVAHRIGPTTTSTQNPDIASFTSGFGSVTTIWIIGLAVSNSVSGVTSAPSGYGNLTTGGNSTSSNYAVIHAAHQISTAASDDSGAWTMESAKAWVPVVVAVK